MSEFEDALVEKFKEAWHKADEAGLAGNRTQAGIDAVLSFIAEQAGDGPEDGMFVAQVMIERRMNNEGGLEDRCYAIDGDGEELPLVEALGMMRLAEDSIIRARMDEEPE